ncbi:MAG: UDP-N-acetylmuramoyl-L-alanine--D-glutamate ligase [Nitrospirae bacterium]|nr:UDP-N-acetylmuramoyl-L-alanine--D-glutamate ligase [Nitrospirota bacterium]
MEIKGKKVTIVGIGRSGVGAANILSELGAEVTITDRKTVEELRNFIDKIDYSVRTILGGHPEDIFVSADMVVISPGVPLDLLPLKKVMIKGIPIIGELELAYQIIQSSDNSKKSLAKSTDRYPIIDVPSVDSSLIAQNPMPHFLAITGTNGKSTTTALLDFMLKKGGYKTILGGNIGVALTEEIRKLLKDKIICLRQIDYIVSEVSSFQLESIKDFRPKGALILNITPDHLDRYHCLKDYFEAKSRIFENQGEGDFLIINADDTELTNFITEKLKVKGKKPKVFYFSREKEVEGIYFKNGEIYCNLPQISKISPHSLLINAEELKIKGVHNLENAMAASAMALLAGCHINALRDSLKEFKGLEHRLEFVREIDGVKYFNDSKGTNVGAVIKSIESFDRSVILIAGGRDKAGDFSVLRDSVKKKVKAIVLIGEAAEKIKRALGDLTETFIAEGLKEAVEISRSISKTGDVVLLSPACASFDMFNDFEDRGRQFKQLVAEIN